MTSGFAHTLGRIGWIGLGRMGEPMAGRLLDAGHGLTVFNRDASKAAALVGRGATLATSVASLAAECRIVFSMIQDDPALHDITLGDAGVLDHLAAGSIYIDMSTVTPDASAIVAEAAAARGVAYLRAPVSGSTRNAVGGILTIFASGSRAAFDSVEPLLALLGSKRYYTGGEEQARFLKLAINLMVGTTACVLAEALVLGEKGGVDWAQMLDIIQTSVVGSPLIGYKVEPLKRRDFSPTFTATQMAKDFDYVLDVARQLRVPVALAGLVRQNWSAMQGSGRADFDAFGYVDLLEQLAGIAPAPSSGDM